MRKILLLLLICKCLLVNGQGFIDKFINTYTVFTITTGSKKMKIDRQIVLEQAYQNFDKKYDHFVTTKEYNLQFISKQKVKEVSLADVKSQKTYTGVFNLGGKGYFVKFLDSRKNLLYELYQPFKDFDLNYNKGESGFYFYSIALRNFPIIMLDRVREIDIVIVK